MGQADHTLGLAEPPRQRVVRRQGNALGQPMGVHRPALCGEPVAPIGQQLDAAPHHIDQRCQVAHELEPVEGRVEMLASDAVGAASASVIACTE